MVETRIAPRFRVSKDAIIEFIGCRPIHCLVRDLSETGAAVELPDGSFGIPDSFLLVLPDDGLRLLCRIVWRRDYRIGVTFE